MKKWKLLGPPKDIDMGLVTPPILGCQDVAT